MKSIILAMAMLCAFLSTTAEARHRHRSYVAHPQCNIIMPCEGVVASPRGLRIEQTMPFGAAVKTYTPRHTRVHRRERVRTARYVAPRARHGRTLIASVNPAQTMQPAVSAGVTPRGRSLDGVIPVLAGKVQEIVSSCGSTVISAVRHTFIAGTRTISQHASGTAVDVQGNPSCIYSMLKGWPGGYSIDYGRVNHVHISYGGREHGVRFAHGGGRHYGRRYAHRHHYRHRVRYASAHR